MEQHSSAHSAVSRLHCLHAPSLLTSTPFHPISGTGISSTLQRTSSWAVPRRACCTGHAAPRCMHSHSTLAGTPALRWTCGRGKPGSAHTAEDALLHLLLPPIVSLTGSSCTAVKHLPSHLWPPTPVLTTTPLRCMSPPLLPVAACATGNSCSLRRRWVWWRLAGWVRQPGNIFCLGLHGNWLAADKLSHAELATLAPTCPSL